jgi:dihydrofolate reductase
VASRGGEYADKINGMAKYVVSATLEDPEWRNTTVSGDRRGPGRRGGEAEAGAGRRHPGPRSAQLVYTLSEHDLVDEWRLMVFPIVLGAGKRNFGDPGDVLRCGSRTSDWRLRWRRARDLRAESTERRRLQTSVTRAGPKLSRPIPVPSAETPSRGVEQMPTLAVSKRWKFEATVRDSCRDPAPRCSPS